MARLMTAKDVREKKFTARVNPLTGRIWYDADEVDDLLEALAQQLTWMREPVRRYLEDMS